LMSLSSLYRAGPLATSTLPPEALEKLFDVAERIARNVNALDFARHHWAFLLIDPEIFIKPNRPFLQLVATAAWLFNSCRASTCLLEATLLRLGMFNREGQEYRVTREFLQSVLRSLDDYKLPNNLRRTTAKRITETIYRDSEEMTPASLPSKSQRRGGYECLACDMHSFLAGTLLETTAYTEAICRLFKSPVGKCYEISVGEDTARERVRGVVTYKGNDVGGTGWNSFLRHLSKGDPTKCRAGNSYRQITVFSRANRIITMNPRLVSLVATRITEI
jgi:hypothetical protein